MFPDLNLTGLLNTQRAPDNEEALFMSTDAIKKCTTSQGPYTSLIWPIRKEERGSPPSESETWNYQGWYIDTSNKVLFILMLLNAFKL